MAAGGSSKHQGKARSTATTYYLHVYLLLPHTYVYVRRVKMSFLAMRNIILTLHLSIISVTIFSLYCRCFALWFPIVDLITMTYIGFIPSVLWIREGLIQLKWRSEYVTHWSQAGTNTFDSIKCLTKRLHKYVYILFKTYSSPFLYH